MSVILNQELENFKKRKDCPLHDESYFKSLNELINLDIQHNIKNPLFEYEINRKKIHEDPLKLYELEQEIKKYEKQLKKDNMVLSRKDHMKFRLLKKLAKKSNINIF